MGMGFGGGYADALEVKDLKKVVPDAVKAFLKKLRWLGVTFDNAMNFLAHRHLGYDFWDYGGDDFDPDRLRRKWKEVRHVHDDDVIGTRVGQEIEEAHAALADAFRLATTEGDSVLTLHPCYHGEDDGDRYDEVEGGYWHVGGMYEISPAGKKLRTFGKDLAERKFFVTHG
jgi:hypothetical protein